MEIDKVNFQVFFNHFKQSSFKRFKIDYMIKIINNEFLFEISGKYNSEYFSIFGIYDKCFRQIKTDKLDILNTQINIIKRNSFYKDNKYKIFIYSYSYINRYEENNIFICSHLNFERIFMEKLNYIENSKQITIKTETIKTKTSKTIKNETKFISINNTNKNKRFRNKYEVNYVESTDEDDEIYQKVTKKYKGDDKETDDDFIDLQEESQYCYEDTIDFFNKKKWTEFKSVKRDEYKKPSLNNIKTDNDIILISDNEKINEILSDKDNEFDELINTSNKTTFVLNNIDEVEIDGIHYKNIAQLKFKVDRDIYDIIKKD